MSAPVKPKLIITVAPVGSYATTADTPHLPVTPSAIIEDGIASGAFAPGDPKLLTFAVLGAANWITRWYDPRGPATSDEIGHAFADFLLRGLRRSK